MKKQNFPIFTCPSCGSSAIRKVTGRCRGNYRGRRYTVEGLEYYTCPRCHEKVYPPEAMRRIQAASPAYSKPRSVRRAIGGRG